MLVSELRHEEAVYLDADRLEEICQQFGYSGGEVAICAAMEDIADLLQQAGKQWRGQDLSGLEASARQAAVLAERIGMSGLARVAGNVMALTEGKDMAALAATVARMRRLGEQSLLAIWDRQDLTI